MNTFSKSHGLVEAPQARPMVVVRNQSPWTGILNKITQVVFLLLLFCGLGGVASAQTTPFDINAFLTDVDVDGTLEVAAGEMASPMFVIVGLMLAITVVTAIIAWARKGLKGR